MGVRTSSSATGRLIADPGRAPPLDLTLPLPFLRQARHYRQNSTPLSSKLRIHMTVVVHDYDVKRLVEESYRTATFAIPCVSIKWPLARFTTLYPVQGSLQATKTSGSSISDGSSAADVPCDCVNSMPPKSWNLLEGEQAHTSLPVLGECVIMLQAFIHTMLACGPWWTC
jgi:hypothetical protein